MAVAFTMSRAELLLSVVAKENYVTVHQQFSNNYSSPSFLPASQWLYSSIDIVRLIYYLHDQRTFHTRLYTFFFRYRFYIRHSFSYIKFSSIKIVSSTIWQLYEILFNKRWWKIPLCQYLSCFFSNIVLQRNNIIIRRHFY